MYEENYYILLSHYLGSIYLTIDHYSWDFDELAEEYSERTSADMTIEEAQEILVATHYEKDFECLSKTEQEFETKFNMIFNNPNIEYTVEQIKDIKSSLPDNNFGNRIEENIFKLEYLVKNYNFHEAEDCISDIEYDLMYRYGKKCQII